MWGLTGFENWKSVLDLSLSLYCLVNFAICLCISVVSKTIPEDHIEVSIAHSPIIRSWGRPSRNRLQIVHIFRCSVSAQECTTEHRRNYRFTDTCVCTPYLHYSKAVEECTPPNFNAGHGTLVHQKKIIGSIRYFSWLWRKWNLEWFTKLSLHFH